MNSISVTDILKENYGLKIGNKEQILKDGVHVYSDDFCVIQVRIHIPFTCLLEWIDGKQSLKQRIVTNLKKDIFS